MRLREASVVTLVALLLAGCSTLFVSAEEQERQAREAEAAQRRAALEAAHDAGQRYSAIVYFAAGSSQIGDAGLRELTWFVEQMRPYPLASFDVQGFTDSLGNQSTNAKIARERAEAVAAALAGLGIAKDRIVLHAFGEAEPAATNRTALGRRNNRRVEVTVR